MGARNTGWIAPAAPGRAPPPTGVPADRDAVLASLLHPTYLPTVNAAAVKVVEVINRADCLLGEIAPLISSDRELAAAFLRVVNSSRDGGGRQVSSVDRAVLVVGLNKVRALALGLSLPSMSPQSRFDPAAREHSLSSVGGAILARELSVRLGRSTPDDDLNAALLRDIGVLLIQQTYPTAWAELSARPGDPLGDDACAREREVFGTDHAEVGAEVLRRWGLPDDIVEPIRHHHHPEQLAGTPHAARAELLWFVGLLTRLEAVVEFPELLDRILTIAAERFALPLGALAEFLDAVRPKISQFAEVLNREIGRCPDYASLLVTASVELSRL